VHRDLTGVNGGSLRLGQPGGGENPLHHSILPPDVLVDVRGYGTNPPLHRGVLLAQTRVGPQDVPDGQVVAERQRTLDNDIGVRRG